jgi:hypothetical protein
MVNFYCIAVGVFILSRFFLAAYYSAPPVVGYLPTISVIVACRNEEDSIGKPSGGFMPKDTSAPSWRWLPSTTDPG